MEFWEFIVLIVGSGTLAAFGTWLLNYFFSDKKKRSAEIISANRVLWIQKLRDGITDVIKSGITAIEDCQDISAKQDRFLNEIREFRKAKAQVSLLLNYKGKPDEIIRKALNDLESLLVSTYAMASYRIDGKFADKDTVWENVIAAHYGFDYLEFIVAIYLKCEWERAKEVAKLGESNLFRFDELFDELYDEKKVEIEKKRDAFYEKLK